MKLLIPFKTIIPPLPVSVFLVCFSLSQPVQATDLDSILPNGNTAEGSGVLVSLTSGVWNSGFGFEALNHDTDGRNNAATGVRALFSDTSGSNNTATGVYALYSNTIGWYNNADGAYALSNNTEGNYNTANGYGALYRNTTGSFNTATGFAALHNNTGGYNTANGDSALEHNTSGNYNTANGQGALSSNTTGSWNTAIGYNTLGFSTGDFNIALGFNAGLNPTNSIHNIHIGNSGLANDSRTIRIGENGDQTRTFIAGIFGVNEGGTPSAVYISEQGQLGTVPSSRRFKKEIRPMDHASEAILALKPVTFHYKSDQTATPQFGLIAEEVAEVNPDLVVHDKNGEVYTVRYDAVNAMLLNEFLKEHRKVEEQQATITQLRCNAAKQETTISQLKKGMDVFAATLKKHAAQIQNVSAQLEVKKPKSKIVVNNP